MSNYTLHEYGLQLVATVFLGAVSAVSIADEQVKGLTAWQADKRPAARPAVSYKPPLLDTALAMEDAGTRTGVGKTAILEVLAPDHVGLTTNAQPVLYWYARTPTAEDFEFRLVRKDRIPPLLKTRVKNRKVAGIHQLDLADHNISLEPGVSHQWSVTAGIDKDGHAGSITASGTIVRIKPGEGLNSRIEKNHGMDLVEVCAIEGIWYDALESISSMIEESPEDQALMAVRASLLEQAGLHASAGN